MANYTALVDVKVDVGRTNKAFKNIEGSLLRVSKQTKSTNRFLSTMENTFSRMEKTFGKIHRAQSHQINNLKKMGNAAAGTAKEISDLQNKVQALEKALKNTNDQSKKQIPILQRLNKFYKQNAYLVQSMAAAFIGFLQYNIVGALRRMSDQFVLLGNRLRMVDDTVRGFNQNLNMAYRLAQETRVPFFQMANTMARIGRVSKTLKTDLGKLATVVSTVSKAFQIGGATIEEANNAMIQLSQAFASGRLQGDELRSVLELAPRLAEGISKSIGIEVGSLRKYAKEGKLTTKVLELAILEASTAIDKEFKKINQTIGQSLTKVGNAFMKVVGEVSQAHSITNRFAKSFDRLIKTIEKSARSGAVNIIAKSIGLLADNLNAVLAVVVGGGLVVGLGAFAAVLTAIVATAPVAFTAIAGIATVMGGAAASYMSLVNSYDRGGPRGLESFGKTSAEQLKGAKAAIAANEAIIKRQQKLKKEEEKAFGSKLSGVKSRAGWNVGSWKEIKASMGFGDKAQNMTNIINAQNKIGDAQNENKSLSKQILAVNNQIEAAKERQAKAQAEFLALSKAELSQTKLINRERLQIAQSVSKARIAGFGGEGAQFADRRVSGLQDIAVSLRKQISKVITDTTGLSPGKGGQLINIKGRTGDEAAGGIMGGGPSVLGGVETNLPSSIFKMLNTKDIQTKVGDEQIGPSGISIMVNQIKELINTAQTNVALLFDEISTSQKIASLQAIKTATDQTKLAELRKEAELEITDISIYGHNTKKRQQKIDEQLNLLAGKTAKEKALQAGLDSITADEVARQAQLQQGITTQLRIQKNLRKAAEIERGRGYTGQLTGRRIDPTVKHPTVKGAYRPGVIGPSVNIANEQKRFGATTATSAGEAFTEGFTGRDPIADMGIESTFSRITSHNKNLIALAQKHGVAMSAMSIQQEKQTGLGLEQVRIDTSKVNLADDALKLFTAEKKILEDKLDTQTAVDEEEARQKKAEQKASTGAVAQQGIVGAMGSRAGQMATAYQTGGGGLTGLINMIVAFILSNKKLMAVIQKFFDMFAEVFDALIDPIADLLDVFLTVLEPIFNLFKQFMKMIGSIFKLFGKVLRPFYELIERLKPVIDVIILVFSVLLQVLDMFLSLIGSGIDAIFEALGLTSKHEGYKSRDLLTQEANILKDIETAVQGTADALSKIDDVLFSIQNSTLNLAAPAQKLEDASKKYDELYAAATMDGADEKAIDDFTSFAQEFLQQSQDLFKSSTAYQEIYDQVISDIEGVQIAISKTLGEDLTDVFNKTIFELDMVGSDLGDAFWDMTQALNDGTMSMTDAASWISMKMGQIEKDLSFYDMTDLHDVSVRDIKGSYDKMMSNYSKSQGTALSSMHGTTLAKDVAKATNKGGGGTGIYERIIAANMLLVNPQHYAVAVKRDSSGNLQITAKGSDDAALAMMSAATAGGIPIVRDAETARALYSGTAPTSSAAGKMSGGETIFTGGSVQLGTIGRGERPEAGDNDLIGQMIGAMSDVGGFLSGLAQALLDALIGALNALGAGVTEILNSVFAFIGDAFKGAGDVAGKILQKIMGPISEALGKVGDLASKVLNAIFEPIAGLTAEIGPFLAKLFEPIGSLGVKAGEFLSGIFYPLSGIGLKISEFLAGLFKPLTDMGGMNIGKFISELFNKIFSGGAMSLGAVGQQLLNAAVNFGGQAGNALSEIWEKVKTALGDMFNFSNTFNAVEDLIKRVGKAIGDFFNIDVPSGKVQLLKNPFHTYKIGPEYFIDWSWEQGGLLPEKFAKGGISKAGRGVHSSLMGSHGGMAVGKSHLGGGMPGVIKSTGQPIEFEGGEYIINKNSVGHLGSGLLEQLNSVKNPSQASAIKSSITSANVSPKEKLLEFTTKSMPDTFASGGALQMGLKDIGAKGDAAAAKKGEDAIGGNTPGFPKTLFEVKFGTDTWPWPFSQLGRHGIESKFSMKDAGSIGDSYFRVYKNGGMTFGSAGHKSGDSAFNSYARAKDYGRSMHADKDSNKSVFYDDRPNIIFPTIGKGTEFDGTESCSWTNTDCKTWNKVCTKHRCHVGPMPWDWGNCESCVDDWTSCKEWNKIKVCTSNLRNFYHDVELWGEKLLPNNASAEGEHGTAWDTISGAFKTVLSAATGMYPYWPGAKSTKGYYAQGGMIHGASHAKGGVPIYAEGGEFVVNKHATKRHRGLLSRINSFANGGSTDWNPSDVWGVRTTDSDREADSDWLTAMSMAGSNPEGPHTVATANATSSSAYSLDEIKFLMDANHQALINMIDGIDIVAQINYQGNEVMEAMLEGVFTKVAENNQKIDTYKSVTFVAVNMMHQALTQSFTRENKATRDVTTTGLSRVEAAQLGLGTSFNAKFGGIAGQMNNIDAVVRSIEADTDHMRRKMDSSGGWSGGVGGIISGIGNAIGGDLGGLLSDRGAKSFRSGGMTPSQQTDMLRKVHPYTYRYKSGGPVQTGFMAQDLQRSSFGRQFVHDSPVGKYVDGGIIGPLLASQSIMQSRMDSYQMGGQIVSDSGSSDMLLQGIIDAIRDQDMNVNVYTNTEDEVGQMMGSSNAASAEASYRDVVDYA